MTTGRLKQMKKLWTYLLTMVWLISAMPAAFAAGSGQDAQAEAIAQKVKSILAIGDEYTEFSSEQQESSEWDFWWANPVTNQQVSVSTTAEGQILFYNQDADSDASDFSSTSPKISRQQAKQLAQDFLSKVLPAGQMAALDNAEFMDFPSKTRIYFKILLNGLPSPLKVRVEITDNEISNFLYEQHPDYIGGIPSEKPIVQAAKAQASLRSIAKLNLIYRTVSGEASQENAAKKAVLQYCPTNYRKIWIVDAQTGQQINLARLKSGSDSVENDRFIFSDVDEAMFSKNTESQIKLEENELKQHKDLLHAQQLDAQLRTMPELGLENAKLISAEYFYDQSKDKYICELWYAFGDEIDSFHKSIKVDAKTAQL